MPISWSTPHASGSDLASCELRPLLDVVAIEGGALKHVSERKLNSKSGGYTPARMQVRAVIEDIIIFPLALVALAVKGLFKAMLSFLIRILDYAFPVLLQVVRLPLFTARIIGDGIAALLKSAVGCLPISSTKGEEWREFVSRHWSWLRQKISYKAFEEAVHHAFEDGMAWVFKKCRTLTPRGALLVIAGAVLWLPVSFGAATAMHAVLIAKATSLPAWMQILHPLATTIAKSKLLVLPVYPAAWPQAKKHPFVQGVFRLSRHLARLHFMRKTGYRYRQTERALLKMADALGRAASSGPFSYLHAPLLAASNGLASWTGKGLRAANARSVECLFRAPLIGPILRNYAAHYDRVDRKHAWRFSERVSGLFERWSIKFSAEYYEAKQSDQVARRETCT
jgi:hypothetical protein